MVKVMFVESKRKNIDKIEINGSILKDMGKEVILAYSIQYINIAKELKKQLEQKGLKVMQFIQVLGCTQIKQMKNKELPIILIGSGKFHALNLALQNENVYIYNIDNGKLENVNKEHEKELKGLSEKKKNNINRFLNSNNIGIIVSTKPGQQKMKDAEELREKIIKKYPEKRVFLFISNNVNINELENFQIDVWINTSCPGLINDSNKILNIEDMTGFFNLVNSKNQ
jgi:diphthamide biosynthesis enzyme Dph1/Dph2-like protein